jgi:hypothetical protein
MQENEWTHIYGAVSIFALLITLWPSIRLRFGSWSKKRNLQKTKQIESEIALIKQLQEADDYYQKRFRHLMALGLAWLTAGVAVGFWSLLKESFDQEIVNHASLLLCSFCFGCACGNFIGLAMSMRRSIDPQAYIAKLEHRLRKLNP